MTSQAGHISHDVGAHPPLLSSPSLAVWGHRPHSTLTWAPTQTLLPQTAPPLHHPTNRFQAPRSHSLFATATRASFTGRSSCPERLYAPKGCRCHWSRCSLHLQCPFLLCQNKFLPRVPGHWLRAGRREKDLVERWTEASFAH